MLQLELKTFRIVHMHFDVTAHQSMNLDLQIEPKVLAGHSEDRKKIFLKYELSLKDKANIMKIDLTANGVFFTEEPINEADMDQLLRDQCIPLMEKEVADCVGDMTERFGFNRLILE